MPYTGQFNFVHSDQMIDYQHHIPETQEPIFVEEFGDAKASKKILDIVELQESTIQKDDTRKNHR